jgi:hypothetical protein
MYLDAPRAMRAGGGQTECKHGTERLVRGAGSLCLRFACTTLTCTPANSSSNLDNLAPQSSSARNTCCCRQCACTPSCIGFF